MDLTRYKHTRFKAKPNKKKLPINEFTFEQMDEFNKIYTYAREHFLLVKPTQSRGISYKIEERYEERYFVVKGNQRFELVIICSEGCYRFLLSNPKAEDNTISGRKACVELFKAAESHGIDFSKYICQDGAKEKSEILSPHIEVLDRFWLEKIMSVKNVHHIDLNSSYASRICEVYPELKPVYTELYNKRKENDGYFKHVLTNSIGCFQSEYCVNPTDKRTSVPYALANLAKIAVNGTLHCIEDMINKLRKAGRTPILTNTDGIWYYGKPYHDENEGEELGQWKHDHIKCKFLMMSKGAYQYVEDGECSSVVRGISNLDAIEPDRTKWKFGDLKNITYIVKYKFVEGIGVVKVNEYEKIHNEGKIK